MNNFDNNSGRNSNGQGNGNGGKNNGNGQNPKKQNLLILLVAALISLLCISYFMKVITGATNKEITYNEFVTMIENGEIESVKIESSQIMIYPKVKETNVFFYAQPVITYYTGKVEADSILTQRLLEAGVEVKGTVPDGSGLIISILTYILPILLMWGLLSLLLKKMTGGGGAFSMGKSNAKVYVQKETGITFRDVAGEEEAKESLQEIVDFLHNPGKYSKIGAKLPKGALLVGPPGTGKTLLAKAVAGEAHVPFFSLAGSDFIELYVGVGASRVRDLFKEAEKNAPCIIFIDEIDAVARKRGTGMGGGHDEREQTLNQLLVEMDGFGVNEGIIVMAATNRVDILDPAILRPGRFDRKVTVGVPDVGGREEILKVHAKNKPLGDDVDLKQIAQTTAGFTGADLENLMNESAILAAKEQRVYIKQEDINRSFIKVGIGAEKKSRVISEKEKRITAYHEAGHAVSSFYLEHEDPVHQISIIPRGMAGGYTLHRPTEDKKYSTKNHRISVFY